MKLESYDWIIFLVSLFEPLDEELLPVWFNTDLI